MDLDTVTATGVAALRRDGRRDLAFGAGGLALACGAAGTGLDFSPAYALKALAIYAFAALLILRALPGGHPHARFGAANRVTLARLAAGCALAGLIGEPRAIETPVLWGIVWVATATAVADALDGPFARRQGLASAFGARFDMETDAAFTLLLCGLILQAGKLGPWVLAAGLMRYAFVAASWRWAWLAAPLPPNERRKAVCVLQITVLIVCLGPVIPPWAAAALAGVTLAALTASFGVDILGLARRRVRSGPAPTAQETPR